MQQLIFIALVIFCLTRYSPVIASSSETAVSGFNRVSFSEPVPNITVAVGRDATLSCVVDNLGSHRVAWVHLDRQMILTIHKQVVTRVGRFSVSYDHQRTWQLHIRGVQAEDAGTYMCQLNSEPMISQVGHVHVVVPPSIVDAESSPSQMSVRENVRVSLVCKAYGVPEARVSWRREDGRSLMEGKMNSSSSSSSPSSLPQENANNKRGTDKPEVGRISVAQDGEELIFSKISRTDSAAYLCIGANGIPPSVSKRIILDVEFEPIMFVPSQLLGTHIGGSLTLECVTEAQPRPILYWIRTDANNSNDVMLLPSKRHKLDSHHVGYQTQMKLHVYPVEAQDFGHYKCVAKNSLGEAEGSIRAYETLPQPTPIPPYGSRSTNSVASTASTAAVQLIPYSGAEVYDEESRDVDSSERLTNGNNAKGTHDKVYYGDQTVSQQNNNHQSNRKKELGNKRSHGFTHLPHHWLLSVLSSSLLLILFR